MDTKRLEHAVQEILEAVGDKSAICTETPPRAARGLAEMLDGYEVDLDSLFVTEDGYGKDQLVLVKNISFTSVCRHHLLVFFGQIHIGYLPHDRVIGISKLGRIGLAFAHRLQLQEKMTEEIAECIMSRLGPRGVAVVVEAKHSCMQCRGVRLPNSETVTSAMLGDFRNNPSLRQEFLTLLSVDTN